MSVPYYMRETLTPTELRIIRALATGSETKEIAVTLHIAEQTVKFHLSNTFRKLGVKNRTAAVWRCLELHLIAAPGAEPVAGCPTCGQPLPPAAAGYTR